MEAEARNTPDLVAPDLVAPDAPAPDAPASEGAQGVYGRLFREGYLFDFYQAVRLLEKYFPDTPAPGETSEVGKERIFFRPDTALVFPGTDVKRVEAPDAAHPAARLVLTFMGLYGIGSPLPVYFYDELATNEPPTYALRDFLDVFNHRLYAYFYRAWKKYRPVVHTGTPEGNAHARRFLGLTGLGVAGALEGTPLPHPMRLVAFAGRLAPCVRGAEGLQAALTGLLGSGAVRIVENVPRWVPIPQRPTMGAGGGLGMQLGLTTTIGERVYDVSGKFRVVLGPLSFAQYRTYLPGASQARLLDYLVRLYAPDYLDYDVELLLDTSSIPPVRLGAGEVQVGRTTWLGKPPQAIIAQRVSYS